jgi:DNA-binding CsgD family transcriptional regulator
MGGGLCTGLDAGEMAAKHSLSPHTIRHRTKHSYGKMGVSKNSECVARSFSVCVPPMRETEKKASQ